MERKGGLRADIDLATNPEVFSNDAVFILDLIGRIERSKKEAKAANWQRLCQGSRTLLKISLNLEEEDLDEKRRLVHSLREDYIFDTSPVIRVNGKNDNRKLFILDYRPQAVLKFLDIDSLQVLKTMLHLRFLTDEGGRIPATLESRVVRLKERQDVCFLINTYSEFCDEISAKRSNDPLATDLYGVFHTLRRRKGTVKLDLRTKDRAIEFLAVIMNQKDGYTRFGRDRESFRDYFGVTYGRLDYVSRKKSWGMTVGEMLTKAEEIAGKAEKRFEGKTAAEAIIFLAQQIIIMGTDEYRRPKVDETVLFTEVFSVNPRTLDSMCRRKNWGLTVSDLITAAEIKAGIEVKRRKKGKRILGFDHTIEHMAEVIRNLDGEYKRPNLGNRGNFFEVFGFNPTSVKIRAKRDKWPTTRLSVVINIAELASRK